MPRVLLHGLAFILLTFLTQIGGGLWLLALATRRVWLAFPLLYVTASFALPWITEREPLPCFGDSALASQSLIYCALNRHYVTPQMASVARDLATQMEAKFPGTQTRTLDGNFPFLNGFPLLPHLSHDDGEKLDLAFYWQQDGTYQAGQSRSPIGYWGYAQGVSFCPPRWSDLRWDMPWLQAKLPPMALDHPRMRAALLHLAGDSRVAKILIEPHVAQTLDVTHSKIRFQGCRAARHDDHIHIQL